MQMSRQQPDAVSRVHRLCKCLLDLIAFHTFGVCVLTGCALNEDLLSNQIDQGPALRNFPFFFIPFLIIMLMTFFSPLSLPLFSSLHFSGRRLFSTFLCLFFSLPSRCHQLFLFQFLNFEYLFLRILV